MDIPPGIELITRTDEFSFQVYTEVDQRFWFRLVREGDRDVVTDFFLGSFPKSYCGALLVECYRKLGLVPQITVVFKDILSGREPTDYSMIREAEELYANAGKFLLTEFGAVTVEQRSSESMGKFDLALTGR